MTVASAKQVQEATSAVAATPAAASASATSSPAEAPALTPAPPKARTTLYIRDVPAHVTEDDLRKLAVSK